MIDLRRDRLIKTEPAKRVSPITLQALIPTTRRLAWLRLTQAYSRPRPQPTRALSAAVGVLARQRAVSQSYFADVRFQLVDQLVSLLKKSLLAFVLSRSGSAFLNDSRDMDESLRVSFAFPPVEDWFHPSAAGLRRAGLCAAQFARPSFAFSPRSEHVPLSLARLDLVRNWA